MKKRFPQHRINIPENASILIFRNRDIGNTIMATPLIRAISDHFLHAHIDVVVDKIGYDLLKGHPQIRELILFEKKDRSIKTMLQISQKLRQKKYFCSLHSKSGITNELLALMAGIPHRISFNLKGSFQFANIILEKPVEDTHIILHNLALLEPLGLEAEYIMPELYHDESDKLRVLHMLKELNIGEKEYLVLHPAGKTIGKEGWNLWFHRKLIEELIRIQFPVFVIGMKSEEDDVKETLPSGPNVFWFFGHSVGEVKELIAFSCGFIGNDSGPAHIAGAWKKKRAIIYKAHDKNFYRWQPLDKENVKIVFEEDLKDPDLPSEIIGYLCGGDYV